MVAGRVSKKENGIIALAGPISNIILFGIGFFGGAFLIGITDSNLVTQFVGFWLWGNAILGAFNMLPFGPLDGRKVKDWSEPIFWFTKTRSVSIFNYLLFMIKTFSHGDDDHNGDDHDRAARYQKKSAFRLAKTKKKETRSSSFFLVPLSQIPFSLLKSLFRNYLDTFHPKPLPSRQRRGRWQE